GEVAVADGGGEHLPGIDVAHRTQRERGRREAAQLEVAGDEVDGEAAHVGVLDLVDVDVDAFGLHRGVEALAAEVGDVGGDPVEARRLAVAGGGRLLARGVGHHRLHADLGRGELAGADGEAGAEIRLQPGDVGAAQRDVVERARGQVVVGQLDPGE